MFWYSAGAAQVTPEAAERFLVLFGLLLAAGIIEIILTAFWQRSYYRSGFPIFKRVLVQTSPPMRLDVRRLQDEVADQRFAAMFVRMIAENEYAFREKLWQFGKIMYTPLMHGHIVMLDRQRSVEIIGRLNWLALILPPYMAYVSYWLFGKVVVSFVTLVASIAVLWVIYTLQTVRYRQMAAAVSRQLET